MHARRALAVSLLALALAAAAAAATSPADSPAWLPNGDVDALAAGDGAVYLAGGFTRLAPPFGSFAVFGPHGVAPLPSMPRFRDAGELDSVAGDGAGGFYVGGQFASFARTPCTNLAHVGADGSVGCLGRNIGGIVTGLLLRAPDLYAIVGWPSHGSTVVKLDARTGRRRPWHVRLGESSTIYPPNVWTVAADDRLVVLGGGFASANGHAAKRLAVLAAPTGRFLWSANLRDGPVDEVLLAGGHVIAIGGFDWVDGRARHGLAVFAAASGRLLDVPADLGWAAGGATDGATLYLASTRGGNRYESDTLTALSARTWRTVWSRRTRLRPLVAAGGTLLASSGTGTWSLVAGTGRVRGRIAPVGAGANAPGRSRGRGAMAASAARVAVAGGFSTLAPGVARNGFAALDPATGAPLAWAPPRAVGGFRSVDALAVANEVVYAAGDFRRVGGARRPGLAALDATTGALLPWTPAVALGDYEQIAEVVPTPTAVYVGGSFRAAGHERRLAAVDPATGALLPWNGALDDAVYALAAAGDEVYAAGAFRHVHGQAIPYLAALDPVTGAPTPWRPAPDGAVRALAVAGDVLYVGGDFGTIGGAARNRLAAFDLTSGALLPWAPQARFPYGVRSLVVAAGAVVANGVPFDAVTAQPRGWPDWLREGLLVSVGDRIVAATRTAGGLVDVPAP